MRIAPILLFVGIASLGACGHQAALQMPPDRPMPVKPEMARATPTFEELLTPPTHARPTRIDELETRSKPRPDDAFDLPPPTGGAAPQGPAASEPPLVPTNSTTAPPGE